MDLDDPWGAGGGDGWGEEPPAPDQETGAVAALEEWSREDVSAEDAACARAVASDHKPPHWLDQDPLKWSRDGNHVPIQEMLPRKWQRPGFVRRNRPRGHLCDRP